MSVALFRDAHLEARISLSLGLKEWERTLGCAGCRRVEKNVRNIYLCMFGFYFIFQPPADWGKISLKLITLPCSRVPGSVV